MFSLRHPARLVYEHRPIRNRRNNNRAILPRDLEQVLMTKILKDALGHTISKGDIVQIYDGNKQGYVYKVFDIDETTGEIWLTQAGRLLPQKAHHTQLIVM